MSHVIDQRLQDLGWTLPPPVAPKGNYVPLVQTGNLVHLSGHIPQKADGTLITGKLGNELSVEQGYESAQACALQLLATLHRHIGGDWNRVVKLVKVVGFVQCSDDFHQQPAVINGASDTFVRVLGEAMGMHARSAVGTNALPLNIATEVECIFEIQD
jgi:enamine deaminase RidA (YjgF/YER057c/UK114 family)